MRLATRRRLSTLFARWCGIVLAAGLNVGLSACGSGGAGSAPPAPPLAPPPAPLGIEVVVRTGDNFTAPADVQAFVQAAARQHVSVIHLLVKQDEDRTIPSGHVYYASRIAPVATGYEHFDALQHVLDAARPLGIQVRAWLPQFHDQAAARAHPEWAMHARLNGQIVPYTGVRHTEYFVNPLHPAVQAYELSLVREVVERYAVDGVMLDWIRFDDFNMDLSDGTRQAYQALSGLDPATIDFSADTPARTAWNAFRMDGVAAYVAQVRRALPTGKSLGVFILPPEFIEVGQDAARFNAQTDTLAPMCYHRDWGYPLAWWWSSCLPSTVAKAGRAAVLPTMDASLADADYAQQFARLRADFPAIQRLAWFHPGRWDDARLARIARLSGY